MPFLDQIANYINDVLKANALNKAKLQPAKFFGISGVIQRKKDNGTLETFPGIVEDGTIKNIITPDSKLALQIYHKVIGNGYAFNKKSYGDSYDISNTTDMQLMVIYNSKLTGKAKQVLEPVVLFGLPQRLSQAVMTDLKLIKCLITPVSSNMDEVAVFKQEYPQSGYFLNEYTGMFSIKYKIETSFGQACVNECLC